MKNDPPKFVKKTDSLVVNDDLKALGVELSKTLPTYDIPIDLVEANDFNPNEMDDDTFNRLVQEIEETGMIDPIQVVPSPGGRFKIIGGEHRWSALKSLGWEKVPSNILTDERFIDEDLQELLVVRMNVIRGGMNPEKFTKLYEKKVNQYGADQLKELFGYTSSDAWKKVTKGVEDALTKSGVGGSGLIDELKKRTKGVRSVDGLGKILNQLFKKYGSDLKYSFMVFTHGGKKHLYVMLSDKAMDSLGVVMETCRDEDKDINDVLVEMLEGYGGPEGG